MEMDFATEELLALLRSGAHKCRCGLYLNKLDALQRQSLYHTLESERIGRKCENVKTLFNSTNQDWAQVMFIIFMRALSDESNRENYMEIANRIDYNILLREKGSANGVEMLLIGASGLLSKLGNGDFVAGYRAQAEYLLRKYNITPLAASAWSSRGLIITKTPILRLSQVAMLINSHDQLFSTMMHCKSREDLFDLFNVEASDVWYDHFKCGSRYRIGRTKIDLIGINLIVPLMYAYGFYINDDEVINTASDLNESLPAEHNRYITRWREWGLTPTSAFETQALLQLASVYCGDQRCGECCVYRHMISSKSILDEVPAMIEHTR